MVVRVLSLGAIALFLLLGLVMAADAAIPRYSTDPDDFVRVNLRHFWVNGQPLRFVGYNLRGLCHYGAGDIVPYAQTSDRATNLSFMQSVGAKVARVFVPCRFTNPTQTGNRLDAALAAASIYNVRLICVLIDEYNSGFCPQGDTGWYTVPGMAAMLNSDFYNWGYATNYLPQVQYLVNRFRNDPVVFAWEIGNELKCPVGYLRDILPFSHTVAEAIRAIDTNHLVGHGTASYSFMGLNSTDAVQLYRDFDFVTVHTYNGDDGSTDIDIANLQNKPLLIEEAGFETSLSNRPSRTDADMAKWFGRGARGYMNWGLMATTYDNSDGDSKFGIDRRWHASDWDAYATVYANWAATLASTAPAAPEFPVNVQASDATWVDRIEVTWYPVYAASEYAVFRADTSTGTKTQVSAWQANTVFHDMAITRGRLYYYWVKARNAVGESAFSAFNAGMASNASPVGILQAKAWPTGANVYVTGGRVSAAFNGEFYIQTANRTQGIGVIWNGPVVEGQAMNVFGKLTADPNGGREIAAYSVYPQ